MRVRRLALRVRRAFYRVIRTLAAARDLSIGCRALRCLWAWARASRIGGWGNGREVTLRFQHVSLTVDASRGELLSYWEIWQEGMYEQIRGSVLTAPNCVVDVGANIGTFTLYQALVERREFTDIGSCTNGSVPQWSLQQH
jgi:hypothetical protein